MVRDSLIEAIKTLAAFAPTPIVRTIYEYGVAGVPLASFLTPHAERLTGAVLFADISGFTTLTETLGRHSATGAEELMELLNRYFSRMITHVEHYGGQVVRLSGDAIIALFALKEGHTTTLSQAALHAIYAGVAMQSAMFDFQSMPTSVGRASLALKIGIGAGEVLAAHVGGVFERWEYLLAGEAVEQAADAERQGWPGTVILSPQVSALLKPLGIEHLDGVIEQGSPSPFARHQPEYPRRGQRPPNYSYCPLPSRPLPPCEWEALPQDTLEQIMAALYRYVPAAILARLQAGQQTWLADLRRMTSVFVRIEGLDYADDRVLIDLQHLVAAIQAIIYRYEGSLNKVTVDDKGTVLLMLFGAPPMTHEDDPLRALACAHELHQEMSRDPALAAFRLAIGISTDTVFAGPMGSTSRREYTAMADSVNIASRLMQVAQEGETLCCQNTYRETHCRWLLEPLTPLYVRGKADPIQMYRFTGHPAPTPAVPTSVPLIGRGSEMAMLMECSEQVCGGRGVVVSVRGEAGIGKTRLLNELFYRLRQEKPELSIFFGTAHALGQQSSYLAWHEVLRNLLGVAASALGPEQREQRVREWVREVDPDLEPRLSLLNDILDTSFPETPVTRGLSPAQRRENLTTLCGQLLQARAIHTPLLIALDDMHWADSLSWDLALDLAQMLPSHPIMLILSYRLQAAAEPVLWAPEKQACMQKLSALPHHRLLALSALGQDAIARLIETTLGYHPVGPAIVSWLTERSQGNPLFIEETLKLLQQESALVLDETGSWQFSSEQKFMVIPSTLKGMIQAQLDRLSPNVQLTCKVAAVIGRVFAEAVLIGIYPIKQEVANLKSYLDTLVRHQIILPDQSESEPRYWFKSALIQEVAYASLLLAHRQAFHQAVAEWYERAYATNLDPYAPLLADHYRHAEQWYRFLEFAERAGRIAANAYATDEALAYLSQAIDLLQSSPTLLPGRAHHEKLFALLLIRQEVAFRSSHTALQEHDLHRMSYLADVLKSPYHQAQVQVCWARYYQATNSYLAAERMAKQALRMGKRLDDRQVIGESMNILARNAELQADYHQALWWGFQAFEFYREIGDRQGEALSLNFLGVAYAELGEYPQAEQYHQQALELFHAMEDHWGEATALNDLGKLHSKRGRPREALTAYLPALQLRRRIGDRKGEAFCLLNIGHVYQSLGDIGKAQEYQHEALAIWHQTGDQYGEAMLLVEISTIAAILGAFETSQKYAAEGLTIAQTLGNRQIEAICLLRWANASCKLALLSQEIQANPEKKLTSRCVQRPLTDQAEHTRAIPMAYEYYQKALHLASLLGLRRWEAYALHWLGEWAWEWGAGELTTRASAAADYWERAAAIRQELGEWDLARASWSCQALALVVLGDHGRGTQLAQRIWQSWQLDPPRIEDEHEIRSAYYALYQTWSALGRHEYAGAALAWAHQWIQDRVVHISHPSLRKTFLSCVPVNLAILREWDRKMGNLDSLKELAAS